MRRVAIARATSRYALRTRRNHLTTANSPSRTGAVTDTTTKLPHHPFEQLGLEPELAKALHALGVHSPSPPQTIAIPPALEGRSLALAAATGSGKTLAYLLPTMQRLRLEELASPELSHSRVCSPRALILAPTKDLAAQIGAAAKAISHSYRLRVRTVEGSALIKKDRRSLEGGADLLVATPARLLRLHKLKQIRLRDVSTVVVDEADDMLTRGFVEQLDEVLRLCPPRASAKKGGGGGGGASLLSPQLIFVSATLGADVRHLIRKKYDGIDELLTACAHRSPASLQHELVLCKRDRLHVLHDVIDCHAATRTLVFCRGVQSARAVQHSLSEGGYRVGGVHGEVPDATRRDHLASFMAEPPEVPILVCSDFAARGLDLPGVERVVNFDFPATSALYLHRSGRAARMGEPGIVVSLITKSQKDWAERVLEKARTDGELHAVRKVVPGMLPMIGGPGRAPSVSRVRLVAPGRAPTTPRTANRETARRA